MSMAYVVLTIKASTDDSVEQAEVFCLGLKRFLLEAAPRHNISAKVEYTVTDHECPAEDLTERCPGHCTHVLAGK